MGRSFAFAAAFLMACTGHDAPDAKAAPEPAPKPAPTPKTGSGEWIPLDDYVLVPDHERALEVARQAILAKHNSSTDDYHYRVRFNDGKYSVLVWYVSGYREDGSPLMHPGGNSVTIVTADYKLDHMIPGR